MDVGNLISGSSAFSKTSLNIWKFTVHVLLKPGLENFERYFTSMWDECNCVVVWIAKGCSNYRTIALLSCTSKVMLKILQARIQQYMNRELPDVQAVFREGRRTRDQVANIHWIIKKAREFQKASTSALLTTPKPMTVWITTNCGKFFKRREYQTTWPQSWETYIQVRKQQLELDMEQQTGSK